MPNPRPVVYLCSSNNGSIAIAPEASIERIRCRELLAKALFGSGDLTFDQAWDRAWEQMPGTEAVSAVRPADRMSPEDAKFLAGTLEQILEMANLGQIELRHYQGTVGVPFSNEGYSSTSPDYLSDADFKEAFGFERPAKRLQFAVTA